MPLEHLRILFLEELTIKELPTSARMIKIPHRYYTFVYSQPSIAKTAKPLL
jgi:hypothetical protein